MKISFNRPITSKVSFISETTGNKILKCQREFFVDSPDPSNRGQLGNAYLAKDEQSWTNRTVPAGTEFDVLGFEFSIVSKPDPATGLGLSEDQRAYFAHGVQLYLKDGEQTEHFLGTLADYFTPKVPGVAVESRGFVTPIKFKGGETWSVVAKMPWDVDGMPNSTAIDVYLSAPNRRVQANATSI